MKFQFNLTNQKLFVQKNSVTLQIDEAQKFFYFRSFGFVLDPAQPEHRILFSVCQEQVQVLYQVPQADSLIRYQREITRPMSGLIEIEFSEWDRVKPSLNKSE